MYRSEGRGDEAMTSEDRGRGVETILPPRDVAESRGRWGFITRLEEASLPSPKSSTHPTLFRLTLRNCPLHSAAALPATDNFRTPLAPAPPQLLTLTLSHSLSLSRETTKRSWRFGRAW